MTWYVKIMANGPHSSTIESDGRIVRKYSRGYRLRTDGSMPTESDIVAALGILPGSPYENDVNATCGGIVNLTQLPTREPWIAFDVEVNWATNAPLPNAVDTDPTTCRVLWSIRPTIEPRYITEDKNKVLITNKAGTPYDGGIPVNVRLGTAIARRKITAVGYDRAAVLANCGKVNSVTYLGGEPGTVQVDIESDERYEGGYHFYEEVFTFNYDPLGHQPKPANVGFFQKTIGGDVVPITVGDLSDPPTNDPTKVQEPEPLDDDGVLVPTADRPGACTFVPVEYFDEMDFDDFDLF